MKFLYLTIGLPRSGKSTWANQYGCPIVCTDDIRLALHGMAYAPEAEPMVWTIAKVMVKALMARHDHVILDATNLKTSRRDFWDCDKWQRVFVNFPASEHTCIQRAICNNREELISVIRRMSEENTGFTEEELNNIPIINAPVPLPRTK